MPPETNSTPQITTVPAASIATESYWAKLHSVIIAAFLHKPDNVTVFPPDWKRLPDDPTTAAHSLASELGDRGHLAVVLENGEPIACSGILPYRGDAWIDEAQRGKSDADIANAASSRETGDKVADWEICCFCVSPSYRQQGLSHSLLSYLESFVRPRGSKRLYANYAEIETGSFWPRMGFDVIPGAGGTLKKGFQVDPEKEGLRGDVVFRVAVKRFEP